MPLHNMVSCWQTTTIIRAYIGQCLRFDLKRFESETVTALVASLKRRGVSDAVIDEALSEVVHAQSS
jgi:hypothetical protein